MSSKPIELCVPASKDMMLVVRLTTAGVLSYGRFTVEAMEDIKMAVEEACRCLIRCGGFDRLCIGYQVSDNMLKIQARASCGGRCAAGESVSDDEIAVVRCVLLSLVDQVELAFEGGCLSAFTLGKQLPV